MKKIFSIIAVTTLFLGCDINSDNYSEPNNLAETACFSLAKTRDISQFSTLLNTPAQRDKVNQISTDDIIEGYVTSNDKEGNFYKSLSLVAIENGVQRGFAISIDVTDLSNFYEPGRKVYLKLKNNRVIYNTNSASIEFGSLNPEFPASRIGRLNPIEAKYSLVRGCEVVDENTLVNNVTITAAKNDSQTNKLIEITNVQFTDPSVGKKYFDPSLNNLGSATNHEIQDASGNKLVVRFSQFCNFSSLPVNIKNGTIRGVLTKFAGTYQLYVRSLDDIKFNNTRIDYNPPVGGTAITYTGSFIENFESYIAGSVTTGQTVFPKYINDPAIGTKYWYVATFSANKYLVMSSFSSSTAFQDSLNKSYFIVPVDFTAANTLQFKTQDRFNNGGVLKVYTSTNYTPNGDISAASLTDITSNFTIASGTTGSTSLPFVNSGVYNIPAGLTGNGYIIFEYTGGYSFNPVITTTMHIDDIVVN